MTKSRPMAAIDKGQREECVADIGNTLDYWEYSYLDCEDNFTRTGIHQNTLSRIYKAHVIIYSLYLNHSYFFYKFTSRKGSRTSVFLSSAILELQRTPKSHWFTPINTDFWFMFSIGCQSAMAPLHSSAWLQAGSIPHASHACVEALTIRDMLNTFTMKNRGQQKQQKKDAEENTDLIEREKV